MKKLIVVSGGTKGIGRAIIEKFATEGFDVFTCARNEKDLIQLKSTVEKDYGINLYFTVADLSERSSQTAFAHAILELKRPVEILVNNAGYFEPGLITEEREGALEKMIDTNVYSAYHLTRALVAGMKASKTGHIFSICSVASLFAYPNGGSYSISKFALLGFSKVLREELKQFGIRVTAVIAGATYTASWENSGLPPERFMRPQDVAEAIFGAYSLSLQTVVEELIIRPQWGDI
ncbi:MAG: SDR family NAD(P)-dependent oxidoreductase [Cyclobacteriaceae bacterium]|nr:SDR family NAD(P)-dependent oxidoreductase [Cyclobacteriaceae bacterium]